MRGSGTRTEFEGSGWYPDMISEGRISDIMGWRGAELTSCGF